MTSQAKVHEFAMEQMNRLLATLGDRVQKAARKPGPAEIHDLRVSIRRFTQGLQLFDDFFPPSQVKKIRTSLKSLMRLTSAIRDRDITLEYLEQAGEAAQKPKIQKERSGYQRQFSQMLRRWRTQGFQDKWRSGLALPGA